MDNKKLIFTSLIVLALVVAALSITYALNVNVTQNTTSDYDLSYTFDISDNATWTINLEAGKTKIYDIAVTNPYNDSITYGVVYKMDNPTTMPSNSLVGIVNTSENSSQGTLNANSEKNISIAIVNGSTSNMQVTLSVISGYKNGGELIIPDGYTLITEEYEVVVSPAKQTLTMLGLTESTGTPDFSKTSCSDGCGEKTVGIYKTKDDIGTSYYFRGDVENNYVLFANKYWRIIRINGDGSIRMIYAGTSAHENGYDDSSTKDTSIGTSAFNSSYSYNAFVGFMYGTFGASDYATTHANTNDSTIKKALDTWYTNNIKNTTNEQYVVDAIYCNDRSLSPSTTGTGAEKSETDYGAFNRLYDNKTPTLKCSQVNDRFTKSAAVSGVTGNGKLTNAIGLITADEVAYAGGLYYQSDGSASNSKYYLYTKNDYWTMSPSGFGIRAFEFNVYGSEGYLGYSYGVDNSARDVRPVISLSSGALSSGTGTKTDPFRLPDPEPNSPDLVQGLIPVMYDGSKWVKADSSNSNETYKWYDYDNKLWANAVLVTSTNRSTYQNASAGTTISTSDILAFYVWIPRYKYKVWNISKQAGAESTYAYNAKTEGIDIVFESGKESTGTISCTYNYNVDSANGGVDLSTTTAETCTGNNGDYYTHPAFTFGNDNINGFWISKFEISSSDPSATDGGGNVTNLTVRSLPNVNSWRYNKLSNFNTVIQNMQASNNIYGLNTSRTNTDSHMLTNFEWGAVAYLTNSKYGRCTNGSCTEVTINNCNTFVTGIGANTVSASSSSTTCTTAANQYNGTYGKLASTTGNITGVYDMSGGSWEYVMGNISKVTTGYTFYPSSSSFSSSWYTTDTAKYLTTYAYDTVYNNQKAYNRGRLGDATAETLLSVSTSGSWYSDYARFPYSIGAWFARGGGYSNISYAGVFYFQNDDGSTYNGTSSRAALVSLSA